MRARYPCIESSWFIHDAIRRVMHPFREVGSVSEGEGCLRLSASGLWVPRTKREGFIGV